MKASIFETSKRKPVEKRLALSVPVELLEEIEEIKQMLKEKSPEKRFNVNALCVDTLQKAVKKARKELDALGSPEKSV